MAESWLNAALIASLAVHLLATLKSAGVDDPTLWYVTRGAAATAYLLLTAVMAFGVILSFRGLEGLMRGWRVYDLHQVLTLLMLGFVGLHLVALYLDPFEPFSLFKLAWPFAETYRPLGTALGVLTLYLLVLVTLSSWARRLLGARVWYLLHLTSYVAFVLVTIHGLLTGADSQTPWMLGVYTGSSALVAFLTLGRIYFAAQAARRRKPRAAQPSLPHRR
jgi:DMSO/TMAO reductase YedYZ heme-binding membrane subunit